MKENGKRWKAVSIGGVTGIMIGASATYAATQQLKEEVLSDEPEQEEPLVETEAKSEESNQEETEDVAQTSTNESLSFGEAFAAARKEFGMGGIFEWNGNKYTTYTKEEWEQLKEDDKEQIINSDFDSAVVAAVKEDMAALVEEAAQVAEFVEVPEVRFLGEGDGVYDREMAVVISDDNPIDIDLVNHLTEEKPEDNPLEDALAELGNDSNNQIGQEYTAEDIVTSEDDVITDMNWNDTTLN